MKKIYFIIILALAGIAMWGANMYFYINAVEHTNAIYFWIMAYAYVIGCSIIGINCRNQILRLEEIIELRIQLEPTEEEVRTIMAEAQHGEVEGSWDEECYNEDIEEDTEKKNIISKLFKKRA